MKMGQSQKPDVILSNMLWLRKTLLTGSTCDVLKRNNTFVGRATGPDLTPPIVHAYVDQGEYLGLPRERRTQVNWPITDKTVFKGVVWPKFSGTFRTGQDDSVNDIVSYLTSGNYGVRLSAPTGSGKTVMGVSVAAALGARTLVLCHKEDLCGQWHNTVNTFYSGARLGHVQGNDWLYANTHLTTAMVQTLYSRRNSIPPEFFKSFDLVLVDEGHRMAADTFEYVIKCMPAKYRLAVSATWRRADNLNILWDVHVSPHVVVHNVDQLSGKYAIAHLPILIPLSARMPWARALNMIASNDNYNEWLSGEICKAAKANRKVLVLSDRIKQLETLRAKVDIKLRSEGVTKTTAYYVGTLNGKPMTSFEKASAKAADIILATYGACSEGTDIKELDTLFFASPRGDIEQALGRIRRIAEGKKSLLVVDPHLVGHPVLTSTAAKRIQAYSRLGFTPQHG
jgi:superfamily II DNA or RNA helicase